MSGYGEHCAERERLGNTVLRERDWGNSVLTESLGEHCADRGIGEHWAERVIGGTLC